MSIKIFKSKKNEIKFINKMIKTINKIKKMNNVEISNKRKIKYPNKINVCPA
jgi:hypothetical protein